jgi:hypothetical protein
MERNTDGNVFVFSFSREGFEAIVNLTAIDQEYVMAKMADETSPRDVSNILNMMVLRARYNEHRGMEVWLVKLDEEVSEEELLQMAEDDPQAAANLARMGECLYRKKATGREVIV